MPRAFGSSHFSDRSLLLLNGSSNRRSTVIRMHHRITSQELQQSLGGGSVYDGACGIRWIAMVYACCILVSWFDARDLVTARQVSCTISLVFQVFLREYSSGTYRRLFQFGRMVVSVPVRIHLAPEQMEKTLENKNVGGAMRASQMFIDFLRGVLPYYMSKMVVEAGNGALLGLAL